MSGLFFAILSLIPSCSITTLATGACSDSIDTRQSANKLLSEEEISSLNGSRPICPTAYTFIRNGKTECLVSDMKGGASIGCG